MPDFVGMTMSDVHLVAVRAGVEVEVHRLVEPPAPVSGLVVGQRPRPGVKVRRGTRVTLDVEHRA